MSLKRYVSNLLSLDFNSVQRELQTIQELANRAEPYLELQVSHAEPDRLRAGMVVDADGEDWNPGNGAGLYLRNSTNDGWVFLGDLQTPDPDIQVLVALQTEQLRQLTKIALILSAMSGIQISDEDVPLQTGQLRQLTNIALILSSMSGISLDDNLELINQ